MGTTRVRPAALCRATSCQPNYHRKTFILVFQKALVQPPKIFRMEKTVPFLLLDARHQIASCLTWLIISMSAWLNAITSTKQSSVQSLSYGKCGSSHVRYPNQEGSWLCRSTRTSSFGGRIQTESLRRKYKNHGRQQFDYCGGRLTL